MCELYSMIGLGANSFPPTRNTRLLAPSADKLQQKFSPYTEKQGEFTNKLQVN